MSSLVPDLQDLDAIEAALRRYLATQLPGPFSIEDFRRCSVGFSWLTIAFRLTSAAAGSAFILQIGPPAGLFAPYAAWPQVQILQALRNADVPVPQVFWHGETSDVFGAPFFITGLVAGEVLLPWSIKRAPAAPRLLQQFIGALGRLHAFAWQHGDAAGMAAGLTTSNAALHQIDAWSRKIDGWSLRHYPVLAWAEHWLRCHAPEAPHIAIVHGDFRIGNFLAADDRITAILDWEMAHFGDPHEDLGWACLPMFNGGARDLFGIMPREEVFARYEAASGIAVRPASFKFYEVFSLYKAVAINIGGVRCSEDGRYRDLRMAAMGTQIAPTLKQLYRTIEAP